MKGLKSRIICASNCAKGRLVRLANAPEHYRSDDEETFEQLYERVDWTIGLIKEVKREDMEGMEDKQVLLKSSFGSIRFATGLEYLQDYALPIFYFHLSTAYGIMRKEGVEIGMMDYLGQLGDYRP